MSTQAILWARSLSLPPNQKFILLVLASRANEQNKLWPSINTLISDTCLPKKTLLRNLKQLCTLGYVTRDKRSAPSGSKMSTIYTLNTTPPSVTTTPRASVILTPTLVSHRPLGINRNESKEENKDYIFNISDTLKNGVSKKVQYLKVLESRFTSMIHVNMRVLSMCKRWDDSGVEVEDLNFAIEFLCEIGKDLKSPLYLEHPVLQFAKNRQQAGNYDLAKERQKPYQKQKTAAQLENERLMEKLRLECLSYASEEQ